MTTKEEFENLDHLLGSCLASVRCGVDISDVSDLLIGSIRRKCEVLVSELVILDAIYDRTLSISDFEVSGK